MAKSSLLLLIIITLYFIVLQAVFASHSFSYPLSINNKRIVEEKTGQRVKLRCANWPSHMSVMLAEGLHKQTLSNIVTHISSFGLNCIRLTWPTFMFTRYFNQTILQTLDDLKLEGIKLGIMRYNNDFLNMTHPQAYAFVVKQLFSANIMVVADNHVSKPKWCCDSDDGNGFFGDSTFDPDEWVQGHTLAAQFFKNLSNIVAISLRNELRGPNQNVAAWYSNMRRAALAIHQQNPKVLMIFSGFYYASDLRFLKQTPLNVEPKNKVVFEAHNYPYWNPNWGNKSANSVCASMKSDLEENVGFVLSDDDYDSPLFISEFGMDLIARPQSDERWLTCMLTFLAERDIDWCWWGLQGSYYLRHGKVDAPEVYGLNNFYWNGTTYPQFRKRFQLLLNTLQDPSSKAPYSHILYHPQSGLCVKADQNYNRIELGDCKKASGWNQEGDKIKLNGDHCLKSLGTEGDPAVLSSDCSSSSDLSSSWKFISDSGLHLQHNNTGLCLDKDRNSSILVTNKCICIGDDTGCLDNPQSQWFQLVPTNVE
ncbi:glycosyl hydrolase 5 family protein-like isoform X1 [Arachis duranensis]|uniref:Glycosyl hydrolase 5 family protein-like isoform X1 n=1 Tax=Arachis duranensis TaxID=130453 RepID=A0A6P5NQN2_ARADU|nr:glycosyl hydrolase 5 family protein-like isoform X1 [Arachis duranensis]